jgi:hypothetical protein
MREAEAQRVLLIQAVEEADTLGAWLSPQERALATREAAETASGDPESMLAGRATQLCERLDRRDGWSRQALRLTRFPRALTSPVVVGSIAAGLLVNALGPERRINVLSFPLLGLLAWNLAVYASLAVHVAGRLRSRPAGAARVRRPGPLAAALARWTERVVRGASRGGTRSTAGAISLFASRWTRAAAPLLAARVAFLLHLGAAGLAAGIVTGMYIRGVAFEYQATWESTFLDATGARALLGLVLGPAAALLGLPLPDADAVGLLRAPGAGPAAPWIHRYAVTAVLAVVVPRLALATATGLRARALARRFPIDLGSPYFLRLLAGDRGEGVRVTLLPYSYRPEPRASDRLRGLLHQLVGAHAVIETLPPFDYGAGPDEALQAAGGEAPSPGAHWLVALFPLAQTPEREVHGELMVGLAAWAGHGPGRRLLLVTDASSYRKRLGGGAEADRRLAERRLAWDLIARGTGSGLAHLDLDRPEDDAALGVLDRALWPAGAAPVSAR